jgi:hypothetical protein
MRHWLPSDLTQRQFAPNCAGIAANRFWQGAVCLTCHTLVQCFARTPQKNQAGPLEGKVMEALIPIILQAISGAVGGGIVGSIVKTAGMALLPKLLAGVVGGVGGGAALGPIISGALGADPAGGLDMMNIIGQLVSGAAGGGVLTGLAGAVMGAMKK